MSRPVRPTLLFCSACAGLVIVGLVLAALGTVFGLPEMRQLLPLDLAHQGHLFLLLYLGVFLSNFLIGSLIDSFGHKWVLAVSAAMVGAGFMGLAAVRSFHAAVPVALLLGLGGGGLNTTTNALVSDLYVERRAAMLNLLGVFFGVGALCVPLLAAAIAGRFSVIHLLLFAAGMAFACAVFYAVLAFPPAHAAGGLSLLDTVRVARFPGLLWIGALLFFEAGDEAAIGGWTSIYAGSAGLGARAATLVLACYWAGMIGGRVLAARFGPRWTKPQVILASAVGAVFGCTVLLSVNSVAMLAAGAGIIGLTFAPIFQTALGIAGDRYRENVGSVFALLFAIALVGGMAAPWAIGQLAQRYSVRYGMLVPLAGAACIAGVVLIVRRADRR